LHYIKIIDENGRVIVSKQAINDSILEIDLSNYANGKYVIYGIDANSRILCTSIVVKKD